MSARTYLVGLPVAVTVYDDGHVHLEVDAAELTSALRDYDGDEHTEDELAADTHAAASAFVGLVDKGETWRIATSTMQHPPVRRRRRRLGRWSR